MLAPLSGGLGGGAEGLMLPSRLGYIRRHHIGLLALSLVLGGTAYAAIPARNVRSR